MSNNIHIDEVIIYANNIDGIASAFYYGNFVRFNNAEESVEQLSTLTYLTCQDATFYHTHHILISLLQELVSECKDRADKQPSKLRVVFIGTWPSNQMVEIIESLPSYTTKEVTIYTTVASPKARTSATFVKYVQVKGSILRYFCDNLKCYNISRLYALADYIEGKHLNTERVQTTFALYNHAMLRVDELNIPHAGLVLGRQLQYTFLGGETRLLVDVYRRAQRQVEEIMARQEIRLLPVVYWEGKEAKTVKLPCVTCFLPELVSLVGVYLAQQGNINGHQCSVVITNENCAEGVLNASVFHFGYHPENGHIGKFLLNDVDALIVEEGLDVFTGIIDKEFYLNEGVINE